MKTNLFYFSATGNSFHLCRSLADELGQCEVLSIARLLPNESIEVRSECVGIIFPVYAWGMPRIVADFIPKLKVPSNCYVFAVATCVAIPGNTLYDLKKLLQSNGITLNAGFVTRSGRSSLMKLNVLDKAIMRLDTRKSKIRFFEERLPELVSLIRTRSNREPETSNLAANYFGSMFHSLGIKSFKAKDQEFVLTDQCSNCGTCSRVCPRGNILMNGKGPQFQHNCELCHACIQWCPNFAIRHPNFDPQLKQYRNRNVSLHDMIR